MEGKQSYLVKYLIAQQDNFTCTGEESAFALTGSHHITSLQGVPTELLIIR